MHPSARQCAAGKLVRRELFRRSALRTDRRQATRGGLQSRRAKRFRHIGRHKRRHTDRGVSYRRVCNCCRCSRHARLDSGRGVRCQVCMTPVKRSFERWDESSRPSGQAGLGSTCATTIANACSSRSMPLLSVIDPTCKKTNSSNPTDCSRRFPLVVIHAVETWVDAARDDIYTSFRHSLRHQPDPRNGRGGQQSRCRVRGQRLRDRKPVRNGRLTVDPAPGAAITNVLPHPLRARDQSVNRS